MRQITRLTLALLFALAALACHTATWRVIDTTIGAALFASFIANIGGTRRARKAAP